MNSFELYENNFEELDLTDSEIDLILEYESKCMNRIILVRDKKICIKLYGNNPNVAVVDEECFDAIRHIRWRKSNNTVCGSIPDRKRIGQIKEVKLHRIILGIDSDSLLKTEFKDGNKFNCTKENMRVYMEHTGEKKIYSRPASILESGTRFGRWTVIDYDDETNKKEMLAGKRNRYYHLCRCNCGNVASITKYNLTTGISKSCGCLKKGHSEGSKSYRIHTYWFRIHYRKIIEQGI